MASAKSKRKKKETLKAAEDVCWTLMLMKTSGWLNLPEDERQLLGKPMQKWLDLSDEYEALIANDD